MTQDNCQVEPWRDTSFPDTIWPRNRSSAIAAHQSLRAGEEELSVIIDQSGTQGCVIDAIGVDGMFFENV
jgi:hypothetical protein